MAAIFSRLQCANRVVSSRKWMCHWAGSPLDRMMACRLLGTIPSFELMPTYLQLDHIEHISFIFLLEIPKLSFAEMQSKMSSAQWRPFCLSRNALHSPAMPCTFFAKLEQRPFASVLLSHIIHAVYAAWGTPPPPPPPHPPPHTHPTPTPHLLSYCTILILLGRDSIWFESHSGHSGKGEEWGGAILLLPWGLLILSWGLWTRCHHKTSCLHLHASAT